MRGAFFLQQQPVDEEEAAAVAARLQTGKDPVEEWAPSAEKSSYVMSDSEPSKSESTKRIESKRQKFWQRKARLLASESRKTLSQEDGTSRRPKVDSNQATPSACLDERQFVVERVVRLLVLKVIETKLRHSELVL